VATIALNIKKSIKQAAQQGPIDLVFDVQLPKVIQ